MFCAARKTTHLMAGAEQTDAGVQQGTDQAAHAPLNQDEMTAV